MNDHPPASGQETEAPLLDTPTSSDTALQSPTSPPVDASEASSVRFTDYDLPPFVFEALEKMGIDTPTPIQEKVIAPILAGKDVIGKAETGTGKTIGFGAPLVTKIDTNRVAVQAIVLTPTRELAQQVALVIEQLGAGVGLKVATVVGGVHASEQILQLRSGSQVVVGTPGRILDFLKDRTLSLVWCETLVIDEADRMFDMGFIDEMRTIIEHIPEERQTLLFSATIPPEIQKLMTKYMKTPEIYSTSRGLSTVAGIRQVYRNIQLPDKFRELCAILEANPDDTCIVFCNTRRQAIDLDRMLWGHDFEARALHGDHEQEVRFQVLESFRNRDVRVLVATDVASRGLDVDDIAIVVNFEVPFDVDSYVHRIGRTGRASKQGRSITFVAPRESEQWRRIMTQTRFEIGQEAPQAARRAGDGPTGRHRDSRKQTMDQKSSQDRAEGRRDDTQGGGRPRRRGGKRRKRRDDRGGGAAASAPPQEQREQRERGEQRDQRDQRDQRQSERRDQRQERSGGGGDRKRGARRRGGKDSRGGGGFDRKEDALFSNPLKTRTSMPLSGPVETDVDMFDMSMKDFLDDTHQVSGFIGSPPPAPPPLPATDDDVEDREAGGRDDRDRDDRDDSREEPRGDDEQRQRRRRPRRRSGGKRPQGQGGGGPVNAAPEGSGKRRPRRRRRRGGGSGSGGGDKSSSA